MLIFYPSNAWRSQRPSEDMPPTLGLRLGSRVAFNAGNQAPGLPDPYLPHTASFSVSSLLGFLRLHVSLVPKRQKNLTFPEHCAIVISI